MRAGADASPQWQFWATVVGAALSLFALVGTALVSMRGSVRTSARTAETEFDRTMLTDRQQLREALAAAQVRIETEAGEKHRYRELYAALRVGVIAKGMDPDDLVRGHGDVP
jgi:hypothetical protein